MNRSGTLCFLTSRTFLALRSQNCNSEWSLISIIIFHKQHIFVMSEYRACVCSWLLLMSSVRSSCSNQNFLLLKTERVHSVGSSTPTWSTGRHVTQLQNRVCFWLSASKHHLWRKEHTTEGGDAGNHAKGFWLQPRRLWSRFRQNLDVMTSHTNLVFFLIFRIFPL